MQNIATNVAAKALVAVVASAMIFTAFAAPAKAQTVEDLQKMINDLMTQIAALQGQGGTSGSVASGVCPFTWTRDLNVGATGADVMKLQQFLNSNADTRVAASGAGSVGAETEFYGPATAAAVSKMQVMHRADILTPSGLVNPTGFFGPSTRAKANALCVAAPVTPVDPTDPVDPTEPTDLSGEAVLDSFEVESVSDDEVEEGETDAEIGTFVVEFKDGDASISRLDVALLADDETDTDTIRPWDAFDTISLWVDGDMVAEIDASNKRDYSDEDTGVLRFSGLDIVAMEDEELEITVGASVLSNVDSAELDTWELYAVSMRYFDADGVATTETSEDDLQDDFSGATASFDIVAEGDGDGADLKRNTANPAASTLKVEDDSKDSDEIEIFIFNVEVDEDSSELTLDDAVVKLEIVNPSTATTTITANKVISDVWLEIDGKKVKGDADAGTAEGQYDHVVAINDNVTVPFTFDFKGMALDGDTDYEAVVTVVFEGQDDWAAYQNNVTVRATVAAAGWELEGKDGSNVLSGSANGNIHTLATVVPLVTDVKSMITQANNVSNSGSISFEFKVEAEDDDVVITRAALDAAATLTSSAGTPLAKPTPSLTKIGGPTGDSAESPANTWTISEGGTATFRLTYSFTTATSTNNGNYSINLFTVGGVEVDETSPQLPLAN